MYFAGNESTLVEMKIEGRDWESMQKKLVPDPYYSRLVRLRNQDATADEPAPYYRDKFPISQHIWTKEVPEDLQPGVYMVEIRAVNMDGLDCQTQTILFVNE